MFCPHGDVLTASVSNKVYVPVRVAGCYFFAFDAPAAQKAIIIQKNENRY